MPGFCIQCPCFEQRRRALKPSETIRGGLVQNSVYLRRLQRREEICKNPEHGLHKVQVIVLSPIESIVSTDQTGMVFGVCSLGTTL